MSDTRDETDRCPIRVLFEYECPCEPELQEVGNREGSKEKVRRLPFKHDARRCPERVCWVRVIDRRVPYVPDLRRTWNQGALDLGPAHPAPSVIARMWTAGDPPAPRALDLFVAKAQANSWTCEIRYSRGTPMGKRIPKEVDAHGVRCYSMDDGTRVVALWVDGRFDSARGFDDAGKPYKLSAAGAKAWLTGTRPEVTGDGANATG